ncbi:MAG: esterase family protein [Bryobacterales bacterium]|nr:esterase family protein [Bryobacterales bacterium]
MELLVFGHAGAPVLAFPTRQGRFYDYENWGLAAALAGSINGGLIQLFCVDSLDSETFYCRCSDHHKRITRHNQYEQYLLSEVIPFIRDSNPNPFLIAHGCSIGAYHAANIALRHPGLFGKIVALSGRYDLTRSFGFFPDLFDGYYSEDIYFHMPTHFVPNLTENRLLGQLRKLEVIFAVGERDFFRDSNIHLSAALSSKGVANTLAIWDGTSHNPAAWRQMLPHYL